MGSPALEMREIPFYGEISIFMFNITIAIIVSKHAERPKSAKYPTLVSHLSGSLHNSL